MSFLEIEGLSKTFSKRPDLIRRGLDALGMKAKAPTAVQAVKMFSASIEQGEAFGLTGESGCGKSTVARMIAGITHPSTGAIRLNGHDLVARKSPESRVAALQVQMLFQDAAAAMNPRYRVRDIITEAAVFHKLIKRSDVDAKVAEVLEPVSMRPDAANRYPHQFSGGQRQRIAIARALATNPRLLICDESVAALDVSIQAQVINLFFDLREKFGLSYIFISHDLSVVRHFCDRVAVMYLGEVVETGRTEELFNNPQHPYTRALINQRPSIKNRRKLHTPIQGEVPSPLAPPPGCRFHPRCTQAVETCRILHPDLQPIGPGHSVACHLVTGVSGAM